VNGYRLPDSRLLCMPTGIKTPGQQLAIREQAAITFEKMDAGNL